MKKNKIVNIFSYPDTQTGYEGKGILLEKTFENKQVEMWMVKMLRTGKEVHRVFYKIPLKSL